MVQRDVMEDVLSIEDDLTMLHMVHAGHGVGQSALSAAIGTD